MAVEKFSISLPEVLVAQLDALAEQDGLTRSALVREASEAYIAGRRTASRDAERRAGIDRALALFDDVASSWGPDERSGLDYLDEVRGQGAHAGGRDKEDAIDV